MTDDRNPPVSPARDAGATAAPDTAVERTAADRTAADRDAATVAGPAAGTGSAPPPSGPAPALIRTAAGLRSLRRRGERAVVMTMGALHAGHAALIRAARDRVGPDGQVVVTVFVNPLQFGAGEDLDRYPRTLDVDLALAAREGADAVFAPSADEVYPGGEPQVRISAGPMGERLEGASRPGHFDGMLTVVAKLLHLTAPDLALYGEKDAQQLALIRRMARDLNFPVRIVGVPTVREPDGLALSSRNRYLSASERGTALALSRALAAGREAGRPARSVTPGDRAPSVTPGTPLPEPPPAPAAGPDAVRAAARAVLDEAAEHRPPLETDYLALVDPSDFTEVPAGHRGEAVLAVAARVGTTRLIDNIRLQFGAPR
ncbi:pantoate--beta-alanine ligase [Streptomyces sp. F63]|uniref:pantoate--beta-alanine ligase n=1 Tax=Streptomyces sp. F63 TaxID=2824887 RepID=UPI001B39A099|nr:pantoate--beta-alanine ligase [Streptomyces sp. F63]MBQ0985309.1 pantoate--beta-alanine ligase [Streptomyces sp. F63]